MTNKEAVTAYAQKTKADIIVNWIAYTNVDDCENNIDKTFRVNAIGGGNIAVTAQGIEANLIPISTDYVFSGDGYSPHRNFVLLNPQSVYGASKYLGEQYVREFCPKYFIVRTEWLYRYLVLLKMAVFAYKCDDFYYPEDEDKFEWNDKTIDIDWPEVDELILSEKDKKNPSFEESGFAY